MGADQKHIRSESQCPALTMGLRGTAGWGSGWSGAPTLHQCLCPPPSHPTTTCRVYHGVQQRRNFRRPAKKTEAKRGGAEEEAPPPPHAEASESWASKRGADAPLAPQGPPHPTQEVWSAGQTSGLHRRGRTSCHSNDPILLC